METKRSQDTCQSNSNLIAQHELYSRPDHSNDLASSRATADNQSTGDLSRDVDATMTDKISSWNSFKEHRNPLVVFNKNGVDRLLWFGGWTQQGNKCALKEKSKV